MTTPTQGDGMASESGIKVEKGVPIPRDNRRRSGRPPKYPWTKLRVGDSFFVAVTQGMSISRLQACLCSAAVAHRYYHDGKFTTRQVDGGVRVWRVE